MEIHWTHVLLLWTSVLVLADAAVVKVGNPILTGSATGSSDERTVFLLDESFDVAGVVYAFSAYFLNVNRVHLQIWRPVNASEPSEGYRLVTEWVYGAIKADRREDLYLETRETTKTCYRVHPHDRLGLYFTESPGSVAYDFVMGNPTTLRKRLDPPPTMDDVVTFDALAWPYKFSVAAYVDDDLSHYPAGEDAPMCYPGLVIPPENEGYATNSPPTPALGATGATGPAGQQGSTGSTGPRGSSGPQGEEGPVGVMGATGQAGATGTSGQQGVIGPVGPQGEQGATGLQGPSGVQGEKGDQGVEGPRGPAGNITIIQIDSAGQSSDDSSECVWCASILSPYLVLGVIIWLAVVSLVLVVTLVMVCTRRRAAPSPAHSHKNGAAHPHNSDLWKYNNGGFDNERHGDESTYSAIEEGRTSF